MDTIMQHRKKRLPAALWIGIGAGGVFLLAAVFVGILIVASIANRATPSQKVYDRVELETLVIGKTKDEVLQLLGKPDSTSGGTMDSWSYNRITRDRVTGQVDISTWLWFDEHGRCERVHY